MKMRPILGTLAVAIALSFAALLYSVHAANSSDHQDTYNLANRSNTSADITDVFVFPSPVNPNNVVFAMNVSPLIPAGMGTARFFDPTLMWQFKISHGATAGAEDQVIQLGVSGTGAGQTVTVYGPAKPNEVGTTNTFVGASGIVPYNVTAGTPLSNGINAFAGPRADPFFFDLFQFFTFLGDRAVTTHSSQSDPGPGVTNTTLTNYQTGAAVTTPTFDGFPAGTTSGANGTGYACGTAPATNALTDINGGFNVLSFVLEIPKSLLTTGYSSQVIHVWATVNSSTGS
ncbi:MAG: DUF4331 family protein [Vulcanimicrobiaceae bacterium]|jgi:hypothetical protein